FGPVWEKDLARYLCHVIVGQQLSSSASRTIWGRIEERVEKKHGRVPHCLDAGRLRGLRACGLSRAKARSMLEIGKAARSGKLDVKKLKRLSHEKRMEALQEIWGVGPWTADVVSMFYFQEEDIWPGGDISARNALFRFLPRRPGEKRLTQIVEKFAPHRSIFALYLWRSSGGEE
ncbi:MAG: hypothetical protein AB1405_05240, partial [Bdellovibrionota bacterium]